MDHLQFKFNNLRVFYKHTDFYGSVHPYNFYEWTSYVREAFFQETISNFKEVALRSIKMMTSKISLEIDGDAGFGDHVEAKLSVGRVKKVSFDMNIEFCNAQNKKPICKTSHTVVFLDSETNSFASIPLEMQKVIVHYLEKDQ